MYQLDTYEFKNKNEFNFNNRKICMTNHCQFSTANDAPQHLYNIELVDVLPNESIVLMPRNKHLDVINRLHRLFDIYEYC